MGENLDLNEILKKYLKHWFWFALFGAGAIVLASIYLRYATPEYQLNAKIQILDGDDSGLKIFESNGLLNLGKNNVLDEIELIRSRSNFIKIVQELKLNVSVFEKGNIKDSELYTRNPLTVNLIGDDSITSKASISFYVQPNSESDFILRMEETDDPVKINYGSPFESPVGDIVVTPNVEYYDAFKGKSLQVNVTPVRDVAEAYLRRVEIFNEDDQSNIVALSLRDTKAARASDILNRLVDIYNQNAIDDKKEIADRTRDFINDRITEISTNLTSVDEDAENLQKDKRITDIGTETGIALNVRASNRSELANAQNQLLVAQSMKDILEQQNSIEVLPTNLSDDPTIASSTAKYNQLVQERKRLLKSSSPQNPIVQRLDDQINGLRTAMQQSLDNSVNTLVQTVNSLSGQQAIINSQIYSAPTKARALRDITRKQQTTEQLYLYLLQKREEAQIAVASATPKCKVIDYAPPTSRRPVSPRRNVVYLASLILGLLIPFSVIYLNNILDNKVHNMRSLEKLTKDVPILGELPRLSRKQSKQSLSDDRSVLAESLRILRTNLDYLIKTKEGPGHRNNVVFVSSSISGEGKTFVASNLAMILGKTGKKVLLVGADVRNPRIYDFFSLNGIEDQKEKVMGGAGRKRGLGLTDYLIEKDVSLSDIIKRVDTESHAIDVIFSGRIPPNPADLLLSPKIGPMLSDMSLQYDYVIVDTAPMMVVTDTLLIAPYSDHLIYVTRADVTEVKAIEYPIKLQEEKKIKGLAFVVNDVANSNLGYGGMYGYGYGRKKSKWWKPYR